jgi:hypothetical protein
VTASQALGSQPWVPGDARTAGETSSQLLSRPSKHHSGSHPAAPEKSHLQERGFMLIVELVRHTPTADPREITHMRRAAR